MSTGAVTRDPASLYRMRQQQEEARLAAEQQQSSRRHTGGDHYYSDDEEEDPALCPHCLKDIDHVYMLVPTAEAGLKCEPLERIAQLDDRGKYHLAKAQFDELSEALEEMKHRLHELAKANLAQASEASKLPSHITRTEDAEDDTIDTARAQLEWVEKDLLHISSPPTKVDEPFAPKKESSAIASAAGEVVETVVDTVLSSAMPRPLADPPLRSGIRLPSHVRRNLGS